MTEPDDELLRARAFSALREEIRDAAASLDGGPAERKTALGRYAIVLATFVMAVAAFTPPGRALSGRVGELVGIGDPPTDSLSSNAVVIGTGDSSALPYEIVADRDIIHGDGTTCVGLGFPTVSGIHGSNCLTDETKEGLAREMIDPTVIGAPAALFPDSELIIQGPADPRVARITIAYTDAQGARREIEADVADLTGEFASAIGSAERTKFFVGFLPPDLLEPPAFEGGPLTLDNARQALSRIEIEALDAEGNTVAVAAPHDRWARALALSAPDARFASLEELERARHGCMKQAGLTSNGSGTEPIDPGGFQGAESQCIVDALRGP